jgi:hypothetical protein
MRTILHEGGEIDFLAGQTEEESSDANESLFGTLESEGRVFISSKKFISPTTKFIVHIGIFLQEGITRCLSYSIGVQENCEIRIT